MYHGHVLALVLHLAAVIAARPRASGLSSCGYGVAFVAGAVALSMLAVAAVPAKADRAGEPVSDPATLCQAAWQQASRESGVPEAVMHAISLTETGSSRNGRFAPWPWTVNMEGEGVWFDTPEEALAYVDRRRAEGARSFDVGCFQINHRWHGQHFSSVAAMFDPLTNARYAARFLSELHAETGNWSAAAGAYHSRSPEFAARYQARFEQILSRVSGDSAPTPGHRPPTELPLVQAEAAQGVQRPNGFPLLRATGTLGTLGSLVPRTDGSARPFLTAAERPDHAG